MSHSIWYPLYCYGWPTTNMCPELSSMYQQTNEVLKQHKYLRFNLLDYILEVPSLCLQVLSWSGRNDANRQKTKSQAPHCFSMEFLFSTASVLHDEHRTSIYEVFLWPAQDLQQGRMRIWVTCILSKGCVTRVVCIHFYLILYYNGSWRLNKFSLRSFLTIPAFQPQYC